MTADDAEDERKDDLEYYDDPIVLEGEEDKKWDGLTCRPYLRKEGTRYEERYK